MSIHGHCVTVTQCGTLFTLFTRIAQVLISEAKVIRVFARLELVLY